MGLYGAICGHPMKFYELARERNDLFPSCHRPPGHAERDLAAGRPVRHMSRASMDAERQRSRQNRWRYDKAGHVRPAVLPYPPASVAA
jgi:hypothetical protein